MMRNRKRPTCWRSQKMEKPTASKANLLETLYFLIYTHSRPNLNELCLKKENLNVTCRTLRHRRGVFYWAETLRSDDLRLCPRLCSPKLPPLLSHRPQTATQAQCWVPALSSNRNVCHLAYSNDMQERRPHEEDRRARPDSQWNLEPDFLFFH